MNLSVKVTTPRTVPVSELPEGEMGVAVNEFKGEVFYRNVLGIHGLSKNRCWPSDYAVRDRNVHNYMPNFLVQVLEPGDTITVEE